MKRFLYALSGFGLVSLVVMGTLHDKRPLSGTWDPRAHSDRRGRHP